MWRNGRQCFRRPDRLLPCYGDCQRPGCIHRRRNGKELQGQHVWWRHHHRLLLGKQSQHRHRRKSGRHHRRNHEGGRRLDGCYESHEREAVRHGLAVCTRPRRSARIGKKSVRRNSHSGREHLCPVNHTDTAARYHKVSGLHFLTPAHKDSSRVCVDTHSYFQYCVYLVQGTSQIGRDERGKSQNLLSSSKYT